MKSKLPIRIASGLLLAVVWSGCSDRSPEQPSVAESSAVQPLENRFEVTLRDPLSPDDPARPYDVIQMLDTNGFPRGYRLQLVAEVCRDEVGEPLDATIYWNVFGHYRKLVPSPGRPLTKTNHIPFTDSDYEQLDRILKNRRSLLQEFSINEIEKYSRDENQTDGVSGATLKVSDVVVAGAGYTSWTLWHWVNGPITKQLRNITRTSTTPEFLAHCLVEDDPETGLYVLRMLSKQQKPLGEKMISTLLIALKTADYRNARLILDLLENAVDDRVQLHRKLVAMIGEAEDIPEAEIMAFLMDETQLSDELLESLAEKLSEMSYMSVHATLTLFERNPQLPATIEAAVTRLAHSEDPFIARRAEEYLSRND